MQRVALVRAAYLLHVKVSLSLCSFKVSHTSSFCLFLSRALNVSADPTPRPPCWVWQENGLLDDARRAFEKARAVFYANASDPTLKMRMQQRESELSEVTIPPPANQ